MMTSLEQRIGCAVTDNGRRVPYAVCGRGEPLVFDQGWLSHLERDWEPGPQRIFLERLAGHRTLIRYDKPGFGMAMDEEPDLSLEAGVEALGAVARRLQLRRFSLIGALQGGPIALAYASACPDRVSQLVLYGTYARGAEIGTEAVKESLLSLIRAHWGLGSQTLADIWMPDASASVAEWFAGYQRAAAGGDLAAASISACYAVDVRALASGVRAPTLVLHRTGDRAVPVRLGRELAALVPDSTFVELPGRSHLPFVGDMESVLDAVLSFLGVPRAELARGRAPALSARERAVAALVAAGLSNAEIAGRLSIAPRTAESHVEHIRRKLGFRSRAQIAAWMGPVPEAQAVR